MFNKIVFYFIAYFRSSDSFSLLCTSLRNAVASGYIQYRSQKQQTALAITHERWGAYVTIRTKIQ